MEEEVMNNLNTNAMLLADEREDVKWQDRDVIY